MIIQCSKTYGKRLITSDSHQGGNKFFLTSVRASKRLMKQQSVRPDWAIFESFWQKMSSKRSPNYCATFWATLKNLTLIQKLHWLLLGNVLLFTPASGHTGSNLLPLSGLKEKSQLTKGEQD